MNGGKVKESVRNKKQLEPSGGGGGRGGQITEFEVSQVYRASFRTVRDTQRNSVSKRKQAKKQL